MLFGFKWNNSPFPGALTYIISFDCHHLPCKLGGSRHRARRLGTRARRASFTQQGPLNEAEFGWAGAAHASGKVALDKDVLQPAICSANICGSMMQNVLSSDPLNVQRLLRWS